MNDPPKTKSNISKPVLFPGDTSIIVTNRSHTQFTNDSNRLFENINDWFGINLLSLNFHKLYYLQFMTKIIIKLTWINSVGKSNLFIFTAPNFLDYSLVAVYHGITILLS